MLFAGDDPHIPRRDVVAVHGDAVQAEDLAAGVLGLERHRPRVWGSYVTNLKWRGRIPTSNLGPRQSAYPRSAGGAVFMCVSKGVKKEGVKRVD